MTAHVSESVWARGSYVSSLNM